MIDFLALDFMRLALAGCLLLSVTLGYLGVHVIQRRIVFVDLALAQISTVGIALAFLLEVNPTALSVVFTLVAAALLSIRTRNPRVPQEAIMGIVYAVASAVSILLISKTPHGEADVLKIFFGDVLGVTSGQLAIVGIVFLGVALLHVVFRRRFLLVSLEPDRAAAEGLSLRLWDFLFYLSIGVVIALAIRIGGVLLVFSYLVIPPVAAFFLTSSLGRVFGIAQGIGVLGSFVGLYLSYRLDLPTGTTVVATLGALLLVAVLAGTRRRAA
ncbi:MAG: metal ABC transporter permease [Gemmatimonadetes bacterium]|nr:metal ABC transporter permease [Gemmatimonadota bacterium]